MRQARGWQAAAPQLAQRQRRQTRMKERTRRKGKRNNNKVRDRGCCCPSLSLPSADASIH